MIKIFIYELKRLLLNKFFMGLLAITGVYSYQMLSGNIVRGIAYTAPFSAWSYGYYLAVVSPLLSIALLFFMTFLYSAKEKRVSVITQATPVNPRAYAAVRYAAMLVGFLVLVLMVVLISFYFYATVFRYTAFGAFLQPMLLVLVPVLLLTMGLGASLGHVHAGLLYACMLVLLLVTQLALPAVIDFTGASYFAGQPLTLPVGADGEPVFVLTSAFATGRVLLSALGIAGIFLAFVRIGKRLHVVSR